MSKDKPKIRYPVRTIRMSDEVWESLKVAQQKSELSWNQFIKSLNDKDDEIHISNPIAL